VSNSNYTAGNIQHLETREAMRSRIQMYLGSDDTEGIYQALKEIINNSTDEALAGYGKEIDIRLDEKTNTVEIRDYGRGVPFGIIDGRNILVAIYTESHTGGKFDKGAYKNSSGLNGIGGTAVCMSSYQFLVRSMRDGKVAEAIFNEGNLINYEELSLEKFEKKYGSTGGTGTYIRFKPDEKVFTNAVEGFSYEKICSEIKNISYLNKGIKFIVETTSGKKNEFYSENGIADFIRDNISKPLMKAPIICSASDGTDELEIAFMYTGGVGESHVFVNGLYCPEGGSPVTGAKTTITTSMKRLSGKDFDAELIRKGLVYAINCKVANPSFANQTKSKINNPNLRTLASQAFKEALEEFANGPDFAPIVEMMLKYQKAEKAADKAREAILSQQKKMSDLRKQKVAFLDKLSDAENLGEDSILCIAEGDSAGNAIIAGRDTKKYGVMYLRGKMLNGLKETDDEKYYANKEIELLIYALGIDVNNYNPKKLRYGKIAICVDADDDGYHIALLILANLYRLCPQFLKENRVYWLRCPLHIAYDKNMQPLSWYYTDAELAAAKAKGKIKGDLDRIKGLGQLEEADLKATMFSTTGGQKMEQIVYSEEAIAQLCSLMGEDVEPRKEFVMSRIDFSKYNNS
jgi:DNA gyrase/topoisomerase IV subunit B